jgi:hypothetical protein
VPFDLAIEKGARTVIVIGASIAFIAPFAEEKDQGVTAVSVVLCHHFQWVLGSFSTATRARILKRPVTSIHKTPDAISLQSSLYPFERIASAASYVRGKDNLPCSFKIWLNAPNRQFGMTPLDAIRHGKVAMLADWIEGAILGLPAMPKYLVANQLLEGVA